MCITKAQICALSDIIDKINSMDSEEKRDQYLKDVVEDDKLFIQTLKKINKNKLRTGGKKASLGKKGEVCQYQKEEVMEIFKEGALTDIVDRYSKAELTAMYKTVYCTKPLSADNKEKLAYAIKGYFYDMERAKTLLG